MRIVYVCDSVIPSRTANSLHVMKMCEGMTRLGHTVTLLAPRRDGEYESGVSEPHAFYDVSPAFRIEKLPWSGRRLGWARYAFALARRIRSLDPDLVYARYLPGCVVPALSGRRVIFESHAPLWRASRFWSAWLRALARTRRLLGMIVISRVLKEKYDGWGGVPSGRIAVVHDASSPSRTGAPIEELGGRPEALRVGYAGQLYPGKGMEIITAIAPMLPEADFHVFGGMPKDIQAWKEKSPAPNVHFHGFVNQSRLPGFFEQLDVCLLPMQRTVSTYSRSGEPTINISEFCSPLKMFDYMAYGKAILSSDIPVLREVLNDTNAILVPPEDIEGWAAAIRSLADPSLRESLGAKAREDFLREYTWEARAEKALSEAEGWAASSGKAFP